jgi:hypothetical protein
MSPYEAGQKAANQGNQRPPAGSDTASQQRQKGYDEQKAKNDTNKK